MDEINSRQTELVKVLLESKKCHDEYKSTIEKYKNFNAEQIAENPEVCHNFMVQNVSLFYDKINICYMSLIEIIYMISEPFYEHEKQLESQSNRQDNLEKRLGTLEENIDLDRIAAIEDKIKRLESSRTLVSGGGGNGFDVDAQSVLIQKYEEKFASMEEEQNRMRKQLEDQEDMINRLEKLLKPESTPFMDQPSITVNIEETSPSSSKKKKKEDLKIKTNVGKESSSKSATVSGSKNKEHPSTPRSATPSSGKTKERSSSIFGGKKKDKEKDTSANSLPEDTLNSIMDLTKRVVSVENTINKIVQPNQVILENRVKNFENVVTGQNIDVNRLSILEEDLKAQIEEKNQLIEKFKQHQLHISNRFINLESQLEEEQHSMSNKFDDRIRVIEDVVRDQKEALDENVERCLKEVEEKLIDKAREAQNLDDNGNTPANADNVSKLEERVKTLENRFNGTKNSNVDASGSRMDTLNNFDESSYDFESKLRTMEDRLNNKINSNKTYIRRGKVFF